MFKGTICTRIVIIIVTFCISPCISSVSANPVAIVASEGSGTPALFYPTENISICFISEEITYIIDSIEMAHVTAKYVFHNPTNNSIGQEIALPFKERLPDNLVIFTEDNNPYEIDQNYGVDLTIDGSSYVCTIFPLYFDGNETITVTATYREAFSNRSKCTYIAKTGSTWNDRINATFIFKINKGLIPTGITGFNISEDNSYVIATKSFTNWIPDRDIHIAWINNLFDYLCIGSIIFVITIIIAIISIIIILRKKKLNKNNNK